jgi:hypothetical protein
MVALTICGSVGPRMLTYSGDRTNSFVVTGDVKPPV